MGQNSKIEWCDHTFNPWIGCTKISPACDNCYAENYAKRYNIAVWGNGNKRHITSDSNWKLPKKWNKESQLRFASWQEFKEKMNIFKDDILIEKGFIKPKKPRVFCASLSDVFDNQVEQEIREDLFYMIKQCNFLDWIIVTKRIGNAPAMLPNDWGTGYNNVWLLSTICNQTEAERDIPKLLSIHAKVHGISIEPMLGYVNLETLDLGEKSLNALNGKIFVPHDVNEQTTFLKWVIVGGETGAYARPIQYEWVKHIHSQCQKYDVPFFFKQWGEYGYLVDEQRMTKSRIGKKLSGRLLFGREWNELPAEL